MPRHGLGGGVWKSFVECKKLSKVKENSRSRQIIRITAESVKEDWSEPRDKKDRRLRMKLKESRSSVKNERKGEDTLLEEGGRLARSTVI